MALFLVVLTSGIGIVSAETLTGTFTSSNVYQENKTDGGGNLAPYYINSVYIKDIGGLGKLSVILYTGVNSFSTQLVQHDAGEHYAGQAPFTSELGSGLIGYNEVYDSNGVFLFEYIYVQYDIFNNEGQSGSRWDNLTYDHALVHNLSIPLWVNPVNIQPSYGAYVGDSATNRLMISYNTPGYAYSNYLYNNVQYDFSNQYTATGTNGNWVINGRVNKTIDSVAYSSRGFVIDGTTGGILAQEDYPGTSTDWNFSIFRGNIKIGVIDSHNQTYISEALFPYSGITPTITPTPTSNEDQPPAAGYVRTYAHVKDRGGNLIHGANINIKDTFGNTWRNSSSDADGISFIDTLPNAYINIYADFTVFENEFLPGSLLTQAVGSGGNTYYLILYPWESGASEGNVSLYVEVKDVDGSFIPYANVQIVLSTGYSYAGSTANLGSKVFLVPNNTVVRATGSASGYLPATVIGNSGTGGSMTMTINLHKQVITVQPTATVPPGGVTPAQTVDPNDPVLHGGDTSFKAQEMMNFLAMNGMDLVQLCFLVTICALLGIKFGK